MDEVPSRPATPPPHTPPKRAHAKQNGANGVHHHNGKTNGVLHADDALVEKAIRQVAYALQLTGASDACSLLKRQDQSLRQFYDGLLFMQQHGLCTINNGQVELTEQGEAIVGKDVRGLPGLCTACERCEGRGYACAREYAPLAEFDEIAADRPRAKEEFDQWYMTPEHALHRVGLFHARGDLLNRRILIIGDDDLLGIGCALTGLPLEVVVLEVDQRIIDFTNAVAKERGLRLTARTFDARHALPEEFRRRFDVFACDPVETVEGCKVFLSRGAAGLKGLGSAIYFGLTTLECTKRKWFDIQKLLASMNFVFTDVIRNFTEYPDPGWEERLPIWANLRMKPTSTWYRSSVLRLEAVDVPRPVVAEAYEGDWDFFLDDDTWATTAEHI